MEGYVAELAQRDDTSSGGLWQSGEWQMRRSKAVIECN